MAAEKLNPQGGEDPERSSQSQRYLSLSEKGRAALLRGFRKTEELVDSADQLQIFDVLSLDSHVFPNHVSAVAWCGPVAASRRGKPNYSWQAMEYFLTHWKNTLDGVFFAGDEPFEQEGLRGAIKRCKDMGFAVGVETRATYPDRLNRSLPVLDWVSLNLSPPQANEGLTVPIEFWQSVISVISANVPFQVVWRLDGDMDERVFRATLERLGQIGVKRIRLEVPADWRMEHSAIIQDFEQIESLFDQIDVEYHEAEALGEDGWLE